MCYSTNELLYVQIHAEILRFMSCLFPIIIPVLCKYQNPMITNKKHAYCQRLTESHLALVAVVLRMTHNPPLLLNTRPVEWTYGGPALGVVGGLCMLHLLRFVPWSTFRFVPFHSYNKRIMSSAFFDMSSPESAPKVLENLAASIKGHEPPK